MTAPLDFADIQGDILRAYGNAYDCTTYVFARIDAPPEQGRAWLGGLVDRVTTAQLWTRGKPATTLNVAVTAAGLAALGVAPAVVASFAIEFRHGMAARRCSATPARARRRRGRTASTTGPRTCCSSSTRRRPSCSRTRSTSCAAGSPTPAG
jgi:hypothetical protein